jgi:aprataxin
MGVPGAGKSSLCKDFPDYVRINQDTLGSRGACLEAMKQALRQGKNVIVDRTNINKKQRQPFIELALQFGAEAVNCIYLDVPEEEAVARIHLRKNHETIKEEMSLEKKKAIVYEFSKTLEAPDLSEGFTSILITRS